MACILLMSIPAKGVASSQIPAAVLCGPAFSDSISTTVGDTPCAMAVEDLDGDGFEDIVTANCTSLDLSLLFGKGNGHFEAEQRVSLSVRPGDMAIGDLDGDGYLDIAVNCTEQAQMLVYWGMGNRSFSSPTPIATPLGPTRLRIVDLDSDGHQDLVLLSSSVQGVEVIWGDGSRNPQTHSILPLAISPSDFAIADLNRDGLPDLVLDACTDANVYTLLNRGNRSFGSAFTALTVPGLELCAVSLGDINGDGVIDLASVDASSFAGQVAVADGNGDGHFTFSNVDSAGLVPFGIAAEDFDGDSRFDLAVTGLFSRDMTLLNDGASRTAGVLPVGASPSEVISADLNGDKVPDLVVLNSGGASISVYLNRMQRDGVSVAYSPPSYQLGTGGELLAEVQLPRPYDPRLEPNRVQLSWRQTSLGVAEAIVSADTSTGEATISFQMHLLDGLPPGHQTIEIAGCDPQGMPFRTSSSLEVYRMRGALQWSSPPGAIPVLVRISSELLGIASIRIYDSSGRLVRTEPVSGTNLVAWDGRTDGGVRVSSGVYVVVAKMASALHTCKVVILK